MVFEKKLNPIDDIDFLSSNLKRYFTLRFFFNSGGYENSQAGHSGLSYLRLKEFIYNAESVTQIIYAWRIIPYNKIAPN